MNKIAFSVYRVLVPKPVRTLILKRNLRIKILKYFDIRGDENNEEEKEVVRYLQRNSVSIFPYPFQDEYKPEDVKVYTDPAKGLKYVFYEGKKLYFRKKWSTRRIRKSWSELLKEQDLKSPHRYLTEDFFPDENDVVADVGAAEGNFSLSVIERVKKIYIFERNREWIKALEHTFAPWKEKVEIIPKYVSDTDDTNHVRLDTFFRSRPDITFLKIDVDGFEERVLNGSAALLESQAPLKIALCTYHKNDDEAAFTGLLRKNRFVVSVSGGYMINYYDKKIKAPWLRRGLIRAIR